MSQVIKQVKPKVITLQTPCIRNQRTLVWLQNQDRTKSWSQWDAVVTSIEAYGKWNQTANIVGIILTSISNRMFYQDLFEISKFHAPMIFLSRAVLSTKSEDFWTDNFDNVVCIDDITTQYPFLGHAWDNTLEDAIGLFAHLSRYNRIVDTMVPQSRIETFQGNIQVHHGAMPPTVWLVTQYFRHKDAERAKEIQTCLQKNVNCDDISQIVLLTEHDYTKDYPKTTKIQQQIIKKRLTYAHFLQFVKDRVPANTIVILANADMYMEDLTDLWKINLKSTMLSLLRWDVTEDGPQLFGPRADSQDTWVILSDSVKEVDWAYEKFDVQLGQPGCDNVFAGQMLQNRFVLYNPALTIKTYHLHKTNVRNYTKDDMIRALLYVNLVPSHLMDTKHEKPTDPVRTISNESVGFEVKSSSLSNEITYCTMLEKEGRYKWEPSVENYYFDEIVMHQWKNACVTPTGLVYTPYAIYPGDDTRFPFWKSSTVHLYTPLQTAEQMIAIPFDNMSVFMNRQKYILYYLSYVLRFLEYYPTASFWIPWAYRQLLTDYNIRATPLFLSEDTACYAKEIVGCMPNIVEPGMENIAVLRSYIPAWIEKPVGKRCVVIGSYTQPLHEIFCKEWFIEYQEEATVESLIGATLCIIYNTTSIVPLWALPKGACVVEFQQELELTGELQHLAHISELQSWVLLLSKGTKEQVEKQITQELTRWIMKNEDSILF